MEYEKIYNDFYSKNYNRFEEYIKRYWIKQKEARRSFGFAISNVNKYIDENLKKRHNFPTDSQLNHLFNQFQSRFALYDSEYATAAVLSEEIKTGFDAINASQLPMNYNYGKFIKEIALLDVIHEISRLLSNNSQYFPLFYDNNDFTEFEIRDCRCSPDNYPLFKKLLQRKYPEVYLPEQHKVDMSALTASTVSDLEITYNINNWNPNCFALFKYLVDNYEKKGKVKFVNIFYYLRDHSDKVSYSFRFTIDGYKSFIASNYNIKLRSFKKAEFEFHDKEVPILNNFQKDFTRIN